MNASPPATRLTVWAFPAPNLNFSPSTLLAWLTIYIMFIASLYGERQLLENTGMG